MTLPHNRYLTTLIAGKLTDKEIHQDLTQNALPVPAPVFIKEIRDAISIGQEDYFKPGSRESVNVSWLKELDIEAMFGYRFDKAVSASLNGITGAFKVLNDKTMYRTITALAMASVTADDIELLVNAKYDIEYSSEDLDTFLHYFFDIKSWSYYDKDTYANSMKDKTLKRDYKMALNEPKDFVMWKLGLTPTLSFDQMLRDMTYDTYFNFKEQSTVNPDQAHKWGMLMLKVQERLEKVEKDINADSGMQEDMISLFGDVDTTVTQTVTTVSKTAPKDGEKPTEEEDPFIQLSVQQGGKEVPNILNLEDLN